MPRPSSESALILIMEYVKRNEEYPSVDFVDKQFRGAVSMLRERGYVFTEGKSVMPTSSGLVKYLDLMGGNK